MREPLFPRRYFIQPTDSVFDTGVLPNGEQIIIGIHAPHIVIVIFDAAGSLQRTLEENTPLTTDELLGPLGTAWMRAWCDSHRVARRAISVRAFLLPELHIGISDLPEWLRDFLEDPDSYTEDERSHISEVLAEWRQLRMFSFQWVEEYDMSADGEVVGS